MNEEELNREVLRLTREGLTPTAVGARLNLPIGEVKSRLEAVGFPVTRPDYYKGMEAADIRHEITRLHFEGKTPETIAHELRTNLGYVVRRLRQADLEPHTEPETIERAAEKHEEILALGRQGVPRHEIAERLGIPWDIVAKALDKAKIKPILPACADIATWARTLSPIIEEIRVSVPNAEPILAKADQLEKKLVGISEAAAKTLEMIPWQKENSERYCLGDARHLIGECIDLADALKGCIDQREVAELPRLLEQAENCIENVSNIMTGFIKEMAEEASIASPKSATGGESMEERGIRPGNPGKGTEVYVQELPKCDFCDKPAGYDGKTRMGPWAYMCEAHFRQYGIGLGTGRGQKLIPRKALGEAERIRGEPEKELSVRMTEDDLEVATVEDVWYPVCPYCGTSTPAEPDAHAVYCQACSRRFKIINPFFSNLGEKGEFAKPAVTKVTEWIDKLRGIEKTYWDSANKKLTIYYNPDTTMERASIEVNKYLADRQLQASVEQTIFISTEKGTFKPAIPKAEPSMPAGIKEPWQMTLGLPNNPSLAEREARRVLGLPEVGPEIKAIAEEAAVKASELTGAKIVEQVAKELSGQVLHESPISPHCERVLETPPPCYDFRGVRSYVLCRAWDLMEKEKRTRLPVGEAWAEARRVCIRE